ncbi:Rieske 2Fe-2S domain-containing protein [Methylorubrum sp. SB2]|uniref:Rieske 2Fe-2S domain-containing protein n=1 Tax=Methylorubrum subtropicum TaxID=3138812 RepID=UPI00313ECE6D
MTTETVPTRGLWLKQAGDSVPGQRDLHGGIVAAIVAAVAELKGEPAADRLRGEGLEALHHVLGPLDLGPVRDRVLEGLRNRMLAFAVEVGRTVLGWDGEFYVDDYLILRLNIPYEVARKADPSGENPGIGRISPWMRETAAARRVKDPLYDPKGYHKGHPPAAWAHGPHLDSWAGHSRDGLNIWWAMCDVPAEASMVLYPELADRTLPCDRRTLYLGQDYPLPAPTFVPLAPGEMLVFDPEILHGTHLNVTDRTRVAVSMRLNASKPTFDPDCFYAREFWRTASDIEAQRFDWVLHLKREEHLGAPAPAPVEARPYPGTPAVVPATVADGTARVARAAPLADGERFVAALPDRRLIVARTGDRLSAVDAACPHYGVDLAFGGQVADKIYCPACAVAFDLHDGTSRSESLSLARYRTWEEGGAILIDLS